MPNTMYYLVMSTNVRTSGLYFAGGGISYAPGDALQFAQLGPSSPPVWAYMSGGAAVHGAVNSSGNGDFTFRTFTDPTFTAAAVPEPETYALFLAGLGLVAGAQWRRRRG